MLVSVQATPNEEGNLERYRKFINDLIDDWDSTYWNDSIDAPDGKEQSLLVKGLTVHGYEQARAYLAASDVVPGIAVSSLALDVYVGCITAQWLVLVPDGWKAIAKEHAQQRYSIAADLRKSIFPNFDILASTMEGLARYDPEQLDSPHTEQGQDFEKLCADLVPPELYIAIRSHACKTRPTVSVLESWISGPSTPGGPWRVPFMETGATIDDLNTLAVSLIMLSSALATLTENSEWKDDLADRARQLNMGPNLQLSQTYHDRMKSHSRSIPDPNS